MKYLLLASLLAGSLNDIRTCWMQNDTIICMTVDQMTNSGMAVKPLPDGTPCFELPNGAKVCRK